MFTGIIEEVGTVITLEPVTSGARLRVRCQRALEGTGTGGSIAVNGVCLTLVELGRDFFAADVSAETLHRSNLGDLRPGDLVNLERPLGLTDRLGGHIVQGHVDGTGRLVSLQEIGSGHWWLRIRFPVELAPYLVVKGSIAVDGISLTIAALEEDIFAATIIPHTFRHTALRVRRPGDKVNLEVDILAKYVERLLACHLQAQAPRLTEEKLRALGY